MQDYHDIKSIAETYADMIREKSQTNEARDMEGKDYTFVATVRGMTNARKKASEYSNAQIVQIDNDFYGVIVPAK